MALLLHHPVRRAEDDGGQCMVHFLGKTTTTSSFAMYTFSAAVFVQALVLISFSSVADYGESIPIVSMPLADLETRPIQKETASSLLAPRCWSYYVHGVGAPFRVLSGIRLCHCCRGLPRE